MVSWGSSDRSYLISRTAFVSTYSPRQCGIATFTYDLATTVGEREIVALHPAGEPGPYPAEVRHRIRRDAEGDYGYVAQALNDCGVNIVSVQYDPDIWGGDEGSYVLDFVKPLHVPYVVTLHSVRCDATVTQRRIITELVGGAGATIVMSRSAADVLTRVYNIGPDRVDVVPYGVSHLPFVAPDTIKPKVGLQGKAVILSFGLLGPDKGFESVIEAMPAVIAAVPSARYVILGATSPGTILADGEAYRARLEKLVTTMSLTEHVKFVDRFVGRVELGTWLEAADVFVAPSPQLDQTVSGTLAYAMGAGKAIVSTRSAYAEEQLAGGRGRFVETGSPKEYAEAIIDLLGDPDSRTAMGKRAYDHSRGMVWWEVGRQYRTIFDRAAHAVSGASGRFTPTGRKLAAAIV
jgi:glycosyltransferase involved in cell wall biosynthesis